MTSHRSGVVRDRRAVAAAGAAALLALVQLPARAADCTLWQRTCAAEGGSWGGRFPQGGFVSNAFGGDRGATAGPGGQVLAVPRGVGGVVLQSSL